MNTAESSWQNISSDHPIRSEREDELGFMGFADAVSRAISDMISPEGLVISIEAPWGSGKSSAIELIRQSLIRRALSLPTRAADPQFKDWPEVLEQWHSKREFHPLEVVQFNPWMYSGQHDLIRELFNAVGSVLGYKDSALATAIAKVRDAIPSAGKVLGAAGGGIVSHGAGTSAGATIGGALGDAATALFPGDHSLPVAKHKLAEELRRAKKRVVIIIDDLDRLLPLELRLLLSVIKAVGDLPNVVYLFAYDRKAVTETLASGPDAIEEKFLDKIVQVSLQLPPPAPYALTELLLKQLNQIVGDAEPADQDHWNYVSAAASRFFKTARDVTRFVNTFRVMWPSLRGEVELADLVGIVTIQLFDAASYRALLQNIDAIAGGSEPMLEKKDLAVRLESDGPFPPQTKELVGHLFPVLGDAWKIMSWGDVDNLTARAQRRIATAEYYRNYFIFSHNPERISRAEMDAVVARPEVTLSSTVGRLTKLNGSKLIPEFLNHLLEVVSQPPGLTVPLLSALLGESENLIRRKDVTAGFFHDDNGVRLRRIVLFGLDASSEKDKLAELLRDYSGALSLRANLAWAFDDLRKKQEKQYVTEAQASGIATAVIRDLQKAADQKSLLGCADGPRVLWAFAALTSDANIKQWLDAQLDDRDSLLALASSLPATGYSSALKGDGAFLYFDRDAYVKLLDVDLLDRQLRALEQTTLTEAERGTLARFWSAKRGR